MSFSIYDFLQGAAAGATGLALSHPIDTIKSNIQEGNTVKLGVRALYKGVIPPLFGLGMEKAIVFGTYENTKRFIGTDNTYSRPLSGAIAGFMASFIVTPVERLKILAQTNRSYALKELGPKFLYKGLSSTFTREMPGFAIYFSVYEGLKDHFRAITSLNSFHYFIFGGFSGSFSWLFIYPQDLVKTRMQASTDGNLTIRSVVMNIYRKTGYRGFFKGFHFALMRAVPLHAGTFAMFEFLKDINNKN